MASSGGPEAEFHDPRRKELLKALKDAFHLDTIQPTVWACLWLSDLDKLKDIVTSVPVFVKYTFDSIETQTRIVPTWTQRTRQSSAASTPQNPSTPLQPPSAQNSRGLKRNSSGQLVITRSKQQRDLCHKRDQKKCILTKAGEPVETAHIYPFSMRYENDTIKQRATSFWETLRIFWSTERVDAWYNAIFSNPAQTEVCQNLLCLSPNAHAYWGRAYFALRPIRISDDQKRLDVQFFWLSSNIYVPKVDILQTPSLLASDHGPNLARLFNHETILQICSGDEISLETDDPVLQPLPDFRLLEMQWILHRVTAMSGAAEAQDDFHDQDDDENIMQALQDQVDMYTEDEWDMEVEELPATEYFEERNSIAQPFGVHTFEHMVTLRGGRGHREREDYEVEDHEVEDYEVENHEVENHEVENHEVEDHERRGP